MYVHVHKLMGLFFIVLDSLYFQHDELDDMKLIANTELSGCKGVVSERIKTFQPSSSEYTSSEEEEEEEKEEEEQNEEEELEEFSVSVQSSEANETQSLSKSVKMWEERSQGNIYTMIIIA